MYSRIEDLAQAITNRRAILFAGAGVSMSVGLPSWRKMIDHIRGELNILDLADSENSFQMIAEYYRLKHGSIGALRSWMDRNWHVSEDKVRTSRIHQLIVELNFPLIYTTNYDRNLELSYETRGIPYAKISNVRDIALAPDGVSQIVKFHGDFDDDSSLVIAETDYLDRLSFDSPLDMKFRSDALGKTLLFVGYSLKDPNIRLLMHRLWRMWRDSGREGDRPQSFFFAAEPDPIRDAVLAQWGIVTLSNSQPNPSSALEDFLSELARLAAMTPVGDQIDKTVDY